MSALHELDVLIVGAGLSGIGCAYHLQDKCPGKSYTILESKESFGGTWHTHRYPGARSDSDLFTYGFNFRPWKGHPIAERSLILDYLKDTVDECGIRDNIRFNHCVRSASWDDATQRWTLTVHRTDTDEVETFVARYLWMCQGYYRHNQSYTPDWDGMETYKGDVVHPQFWPEDYDYSGKKVVVIGSGATAATVVPAMAKTAAHVTMLQRSPTYFFSEDNRNELAERLRALDVPEEWTHEIVRRDMLAFQKEVATRAFEEPQALRDELMEGVRAELGPDCSVDVDTHFNPRYMPWRQRLAFVPDGDLFAAIREERASVVTDEIDRFVENGIL
ncbi:MAG: NAD(P)/FAD-dependent oxidoreductase, partial [Pseudomonadota bacterium]